MGMAARVSWKVVAIDEEDAISARVEGGVRELCEWWPGVVDDIGTWLRGCLWAEGGKEGESEGESVSGVRVGGEGAREGEGWLVLGCYGREEALSGKEWLMRGRKTKAKRCWKKYGLRQ
jgi:hypothetical protein